jgi:hypothetical protein
LQKCQMRGGSVTYFLDFIQDWIWFPNILS